MEFCQQLPSLHPPQVRIVIISGNFSPRPAPDTSPPPKHTRPHPLAELEAHPGSAPSPAKRMLARGAGARPGICSAKDSEHHKNRGRLIDCSQPAGILFVAVLHFVPPEDDTESAVRVFTRYLEGRMPNGSAFVRTAGRGAERPVWLCG